MMQSDDQKSVLVNMECPYTKEGVLLGFQLWNHIASNKWEILNEEHDFQCDLTGGDNEPTFSFGKSNQKQTQGEEEPSFNPADQVDLIWSDYEGIDWKRVLTGSVIGNAYFVRKGLIRKAQLAFNIEKYLSKQSKENCLRKGFPETYTLELHHPDYVNESIMELPIHVQELNGESTWILKPSLCNRGVGIELFDKITDLEELLISEENEDIREWIVQKYIEPPLLIDQRKFHLRAYVLSIGCLEVFLYDQVLALFSLEPYPLDKKDISNKAAHLTNTCYQKRKGTEVDDEIDESKAVKLLEELKVDLGEDAVDDIWNQMKEITGEVFKACSGELGFFPVPNCFELFGLDFMIEVSREGKYIVSLLELNAEPDFIQSGDRLRNIIYSLLSESTFKVLSHFFEESHPFENPHFHSVYKQEETPYMKENIQMKFS